MYDYRERRGSGGVLGLGLLIPVLLVTLLVAVQLVLRSTPDPSATISLPPTSVLGTQLQQQPDLPANGSSILAVNGLGTLWSTGPTTPQPIASVTKMMTAYVLLKSKPLKPGETGPAITTTDADARRYLQMINEDQSTIPITSGIRLTELNLLQGMLVASANNFAEMAAVFDAGSVPAFVAKMNAEARALGMNATTYADPSGFSAGSVSTPTDQLILARKAMEDPVFVATVALRQVTIQGIGTVRAVNDILGEGGVVGIKTGFTEEAGGNLVFAAQRDVGGQKVDVIGAVMHQPTRPQAFAATRRLLDSVYKGLQVAPVLKAGQAVGNVKPDWGGNVEIVTQKDATLLYWPGQELKSVVELQPLEAGMKSGTQVGVLKLAVGEQNLEVPLVLAADIPAPGVFWKLTRR